MCDALGWTRSSIDRLLNGLDPIWASGGNLLPAEDQIGADQHPDADKFGPIAIIRRRLNAEVARLRELEAKVADGEPDDETEVLIAYYRSQIRAARDHLNAVEDEWQSRQKAAKTLALSSPAVAAVQAAQASLSEDDEKRIIEIAETARRRRS